MKVLVADDEPNIAMLMQAFMETLRHETTIATDGSEAMRLAHSGKFDVVFLDVRMPQVEGSEILRSLSGRDDGPLVVMLTGNATVEGAAQAVKDGAFEYLMKPVNLQQVASTMDRACRVANLKRDNRRYRENLENLVAEKTEQLLKRNEELKQTCVRLEEALKGAERASRLAALGQLASGVAHEIRNPLSGILLALFNIRHETQGNATVAEYLTDVEHTINNLGKTLERLLNFARPPAPRLEMASLNDAVLQALRLTKNYLVKNRIKVDTGLEEKLPETMLDTTQCEQILVNLIINAVNAMPSGGDLSIGTWKEEGRVCVAVADSGSGVPEEIRDKIFTPFFSRFESGTGLGLAISRNLAESHGGDLYLDDSPSGVDGARFVLVLPMVEAHAERRGS